MAPATVGRQTATIADSASLSDAIHIQEGCALLSLQLPSGWDTNALSLAGSYTQDGTYVPLVDVTGVEFRVTGAVASTGISLPAYLTAGWCWVKIRSGTSGAAVNQSGAVAITCGVRRVA